MIDLDKILAITRPDDRIAPPPIRYGGRVYLFRPLDIASVAALETINADPLPDDREQAASELLARGQHVVDAVARMFDGEPPPFCAPLASMPDDRSRGEAVAVVQTVLAVVTRWFTERSKKKRLAAQAEIDRQVDATIYPTAALTT